MNMFTSLKTATLVFACVGLGAAALTAQTKPPLPVRVLTASTETYRNSISLTGAIAAQHTLTLSFRTSGKVSERLVDVGHHVEAGALLARLDASIQNADLAAAQAALDAAQAQLDQATADLHRSRELLDKGFTTRAVFDRTEAAEILAQGALKSAEAQVELAQDNQTYADLYAPASGTITASFPEVGQIVQVAQPMFTLAENGKRDAVFDVQESVLSDPPDDFRIDIALLEQPGRTVQCFLREVSPIIDPNTGTVRVLCGIDTPPADFSLGAVVRGTALLGSETVIVLPWSALASDSGRTAVWIYDPTSETVSKRAVDVDRYENGGIVLRHGIEDGSIVVIEGTKFLHEGMSVVPVAEGSR